MTVDRSMRMLGAVHPFRSARFLRPNHDGILVPPNLVDCGGRFINPTGPGIAPNPLFHEVRSMDCEVTPPGAVVAPEVVVGVALWDTY